MHQTTVKISNAAENVEVVKLIRTTKNTTKGQGEKMIYLVDLAAMMHHLYCKWHKIRDTRTYELEKMS